MGKWFWVVVVPMRSASDSPDESDTPDRGCAGCAAIRCPMGVSVQKLDVMAELSDQRGGYGYSVAA